MQVPKSTVAFPGLGGAADMTGGPTLRALGGSCRSGAARRTTSDSASLDEFDQRLQLGALEDAF
jgi:hypothetical protein